MITDWRSIPGNSDAFDLLRRMVHTRQTVAFVGAGASGRGYAAEPGVLIEQVKKDEAIIEADTLLLTVPNKLGVPFNALLTHVAPALG